MPALVPVSLATSLLALLLAPAAGFAAGGLDPSFGNGGIAQIPFGEGSSADGVAPGRAGRVLVTGVGPMFRFGVTALVNGRPLPAFGRAGRVTIERVPGSWGGSGSAVTASAGERILAAGRAGYDNDGFQLTRVLVTRLTASGKPDGSFGRRGIVILGHAPLRGGKSTNDSAAGVVAQPRGKILVAGTVSRLLRNDDTDIEAPRDQAFSFVRLNSDGSLDRSFGRGGRLLVRFARTGLAQMSAVAVDARGRVLAAGSAGPRPPAGSPPKGRLAIVRLLASGRLDPAFGRSGRFLDTAAPPPQRLGSGALAVQADGKPVINVTNGTVTGPQWVVRRLTAAGRPDPAFGAGGQHAIEIPGATGQSGAAIAVTGSAACPGIVSLGTATQPGSATVLAAVSLNHDGTPSAAFGQDGTLLLPVVRGQLGGADPSATGFWSATGAFATPGRVTFSFTPGFNLARLIVPPPSCPTASK